MIYSTDADPSCRKYNEQFFPKQAYSKSLTHFFKISYTFFLCQIRIILEFFNKKFIVVLKSIWYVILHKLKNKTVFATIRRKIVFEKSTREQKQ